MNKKEKLQAKIAKLQAELHIVEVNEWWLARPHIVEFECDYNHEYDDNGGFNDYFYARDIILNYEWIKYNGIKWQTFCDHLGIVLYPEADDCWEEYLRDINNPDNYDIDYPDFINHIGQTIRNPDYAN